jgi:ubiquinone/menaquinone biosynthesis C-methylase UbiE
LRVLEKDDVRAFYDRFGKKQDSQAFYEDPVVEEMIRHADFGTAEVVVEFGCGTGRFAERLLSSHLPENARYWGCDLSATMVALAQDRTRAHGTRAQVVKTDGGLSLPLPAGGADRFVSSFVLDILPEEEIDGIIEEARRILRGGGLICLVSLTEAIGPFSGLVMSVWKRLHSFRPSLVGGCRPIQLSGRFDSPDWEIVHQRKMATYGISAEALVARKSGD